MKDIYKRLWEMGFDRPFVQKCVLPDWWDDSLSDVPSNRILSEIAISRRLGVSLEELRDPNRPLSPPQLRSARFKKRKDAKTEKLLAARLIAERAAEMAVRLLNHRTAFRATMSAICLRREILEVQTVVDLPALTKIAWKFGIMVIHVTELPRNARRFDGMALFCGDVPVIVLGSKHDAPPWLVFHLAHELGHFFLGHVSEDSESVVDEAIKAGQVEDDPQEKEADQFACDLLTGNPDPSFGKIYGLTGQRLAQAAQAYGQRHAIDPGFVALIYGKTADRMPAARIALKKMDLHHGAHDCLTRRLLEHLDCEDVAEDAMRFLGHVLAWHDN